MPQREERHLRAQWVVRWITVFVCGTLAGPTAATLAARRVIGASTVAWRITALVA